jgi:hypothetical protein
VGLMFVEIAAVLLVLGLVSVLAKDLILVFFE